MTSPDPFDSARSAFTTIDDIDGRLCIFVPRTEAQAKGNDGTPYQHITGDVIVIDGEATEQLPGPFPYVVDDMRVSSEFCVNQLRPALRKGRMLLGTVNSQPSKFNKNVKAYSIGTPTEADSLKARPAAQAYLDRTASADPFAA